MSHKLWSKNYPSQISTNIDIPNITLKDMLKSATEDFASHDALICQGQKLTFKEIDELSDTFAGYLQQKWDVKKGDHIAIMLPNILQFPIIIFALIKLGCVFVNINPLYTSCEVKGILTDSKAKGIIVLSFLAHNVEAIAHECEDLKHMMTANIVDLYSTPRKQIVSFVAKYFKQMKDQFSKERFDSFSEALESKHTPDYSNITISPDDMVALQYSSGTTGTPKGTILLHRNIVANVYQIKAWTDGFDVDVSKQIVINALPIYHIFSLTANLFLFYFSGALQILIPNPKNISSLVSEMRKYNFSTIFGVNTLYIALLNNKKFIKSKFPNFQLSISGGMPTMKSIADKWKEVTGVSIREGYGLSEMSPVVSVNTLDNDAPFNGSVGFPLPNTDVSIRDTDGNDLSQGEVGEIWVTGPQKSPGFWCLPKINKEHFTDDGWLKTGDVGYIDEEGRLVISGRIKHMIIVSGFNVFPKEIELALLDKEEIEEAAVIGAPSSETGEMPVAFIVLKEGQKITSKEIQAYCTSKLAHYKIPKKVIFKDTLPKDTVGKISIKSLQKEYTENYQ
ncbi:long-chain-fatty-acid--CoA ligase [Francisella frigiditurris]|uniref:Long-chain-fatty-acid--CoA ligase n=1 Tax=Francisella frigiditurris TaxID=1542390 RepID=A0A1J0KVK2_9GAMM|nr:long-chain fatty acid--CoA ligase [Francisella frigiditurris]APC97654.1 long-chain-fatty-acid--CoA ligase [Francisella frigiditurris]